MKMTVLCKQKGDAGKAAVASGAALWTLKNAVCQGWRKLGSSAARTAELIMAPPVIQLQSCDAAAA